MREFIALTSLAAGALLILWSALGLTPRRPGRHSAAYQAPKTLPTVATPRAAAWPTPTPDHVTLRSLPLTGEDTPLIRPYVLASHELASFGVIGERRTAAVLATLGVDYPYSYDGDQFSTLAGLAAAEVTA
ncbi:hypothetical protein ACGF1Z_29840 [Streptomyces sp. NPDC048018]|uniref:hypothetical protein n=1 Tax=Streptomyces sp. NPDC048018 TaxID=3365499 RepID=UPI0037230060